jgi:hypothetical protein
MEVQRAFDRLRMYAKHKKSIRKGLKKARKFYFRNLFKKSFKAIQFEKTIEIKSLWFTLWLRHHLEYKVKEGMIRDYENKIVLRRYLAKWFYSA